MKKILYRVAEGDTVQSVCAMFGLSPLTVIEENMLSNEIEEGDMLVLNEKDTLYFASPKDTFFSVAKRFNMTEEELKRLNNTPYLFYGLGVKIK